MSLALATKGIIAQFAQGGGGYPVYVPIEKLDMEIDETGSADMLVIKLEDYLRSRITSVELKPRIEIE